MKNKLKRILMIVGILIVIIFATRLIFGGDEDTWICKNGEWVEHGHPSSPKPVESCGDTEIFY